MSWTLFGQIVLLIVLTSMMISVTADSIRKGRKGDKK